MSVKFSFHAEKEVRTFPKRPSAVLKGDRVAVFSPSSPADGARTEKGIAELQRLRFSVDPLRDFPPEGYFAASEETRRREFRELLQRKDIACLIALRGGYGSNYLVDALSGDQLDSPKCIVGFSDLTTLQIYLWQKYGWVTVYGPMVAAGLDGGEGAANGYDRDSLLNALTRTDSGWEIILGGETLQKGACEGRVLGGAMTLVEATLGTPWELNTDDSILLLEDRGMKPYQVDRALMHLKHAGKFKNLRGIVLGEFPECETPVPGSPSVRDVCERILVPLGVPIVFGAAFGHTPRPMVTVPLGVRARLHADGEGALEILEPAVTA